LLDLSLFFKWICASTYSDFDVGSGFRKGKCTFWGFLAAINCLFHFNKAISSGLKPPENKPPLNVIKLTAHHHLTGRTKSIIRLKVQGLKLLKFCLRTKSENLKMSRDQKHI